jgi:hypothetical protein
MGERAMTTPSTFEPVRSIEDLDALDIAEILEGYWEGRDGEPEPGANRGRATWHGWRNGMIDSHRMEKDDAAAELARVCVARQRMRARG